MASKPPAQPADPIDARITSHPESSTSWLTFYRPSRRTTLSRFVPWKGRIKSVLEETIQEIVDECDLGPAVPPDRLITSATIELATVPFSKRPPLRC